MNIRKHKLLSKQMIIVDIISTITVPMIIMFGFYIQFHGKTSPGGGFQSGIVVAIGFIVHDMTQTIKNKNSDYTVSFKIAKLLAALGALIYAFTGLLCFLMGSNVFDYKILAHDMHHAQHYGLIGIETGVAITVFGSMILIYNSFKSCLK